MADQEQLDDFLEALETAGSPASNAQLREALGWPEDQYEAVKAELAARKIVVRAGAAATRCRWWGRSRWRGRKGQAATARLSNPNCSTNCENYGMKWRT